MLKGSTPTPDSVFADAVSLPAADQIELADRLLSGLEKKHGRAAKAAFQATLLRRLHEMKSGAEKGVSPAQLFKKMRSQARRKR